MRWDSIQDFPCSIARTMSVIGDRWTTLIIRDCFMGTRRFDDFQKQLGVTRHLLSNRLSRLVEHGVLVKVAYQQKPVRYEYRLTEKGVELYPIIMSMVRWGDKHMTEQRDGVPTVYEHRRCGQMTTGILVCTECGEPLDPHDVRPHGTESLEAYLDAHPELRDTVAYQFILSG